MIFFIVGYSSCYWASLCHSLHLFSAMFLYCFLFS